MSKFDQSKKFGLVGGNHGTARYEQGGYFYDAQLNLLDADGNPIKAKGVSGNTGEASKSDGGSNAGSGQLGTGEEGGIVSDKSTLIAEAKSLGIPANKNWGEPRLLEEIAKAKEAKASEVATDDDQLNKQLAGE